MLTLENINVYYGAIHALKGISIEVAEGEIVTLIGANGAGKSTTLRTISGLLRPKAGTITFEGRSLTAMSAQDIVKLGICHVPEGRRIFANMTVLENLELGAYCRSDSKEIAADIEKVFARFPRLGERRNQVGGTLSGGEQQMLAIGRALMMRPRILFLDEPSLGLSPLLVREIFATIARVNAEDHTTILLVEQNANMALSVCHQGYVMENGRFVLAGSAQELANDPDVREFYLGIQSEVSVKGYQRYKRKKRWR